MLKSFGVKAGFSSELQEIDRREVTRGIVEEHIFRAWIRRAYVTASGAGVPRVDCVVKLNAGISARPCGRADRAP